MIAVYAIQTGVHSSSVFSVWCGLYKLVCIVAVYLVCGLYMLVCIARAKAKSRAESLLC